MSAREDAREAVHKASPSEVWSREAALVADAASAVWEPIVRDLLIAFQVYSGVIEMAYTDEQKAAITRAIRWAEHPGDLLP